MINSLPAEERAFLLREAKKHRIYQEKDHSFYAILEIALKNGHVHAYDLDVMSGNNLQVEPIDVLPRIEGTYQLTNGSVAKKFLDYIERKENIALKTRFYTRLKRILMTSLLDVILPQSSQRHRR